MELTESGRELLERSESILAEADSAWEAVVQNMNKTAGLVRVSMCEDTYHGLLCGILSSFAREWPDIRLSIHFILHVIINCALSFQVLSSFYESTCSPRRRRHGFCPTG